MIPLLGSVWLLHGVSKMPDYLSCNLTSPSVLLDGSEPQRKLLRLVPFVNVVFTEETASASAIRYKATAMCDTESELLKLFLANFANCGIDVGTPPKRSPVG